MARAARPLFIALYIDEDVTADLAPALRRRGYTAQNAIDAANLGTSDEAQLSYATEQGMAILIYNIQDFIKLAQMWHSSGRQHAGIVISKITTKGLSLDAFWPHSKPQQPRKILVCQMLGGNEQFVSR